MLLLLATFLAGSLFSSFVWMQRSADIAKEEDARSLKTVADLRQRIYGDNYFHLKDDYPDIEARLAAFDPSKGKGSIVLSYTGGMGAGDHFFRLEGDGSLYKEFQGGRKLITRVQPERCKSFFLEVLSSGILNCSEGVIGLKQDLLHPNSTTDRTDCPDTGIRISVPELGVEKFVSIYTPDVKAKNYPDIVEFQIVLRIEGSILGLVPEGYPLWK